MEHALLKEKARMIVEYADDNLLEKIVGLAEIETDQSNIMNGNEENNGLWLS